MSPLEHPDDLHLQAAVGWLELGLPLEADDELDQIAAEMQTHPEVLLVRCDVFFEMKKWDAVVALAERMVKRWPKNRQMWIQRSFALHELGRTQEAFDKLRPVGGRFRKSWTIPYNLACYCAQLGRMEESQQWFRKAMAMAPKEVKVQAIDDPDLKPLRDSMGGTLWKREQ